MTDPTDAVTVDEKIEQVLNLLMPLSPADRIFVLQIATLRAAPAAGISQP
jgi:hypothetical protein